MSGATVSRALQYRFDAIRQAEIERLEKKLRGLTEDERQSVEAITADVIYAIARVPHRALNEDIPAPTLEALVHLFELPVR
jgi:glutamyl-tRNA reductase